MHVEDIRSGKDGTGFFEKEVYTCIFNVKDIS